MKSGDSIRYSMLCSPTAHGVRIDRGQAVQRPQMLEVDAVRRSATQGSIARVPRKCVSQISSPLLDAGDPRHGEQSAPSR